MPSFGCPNCKNQQISENNILPVQVRVSAWTDDGEPASYSYPWRESGGLITDDAGPRYYCHACGKEFEEVVNLDETAAGIPEFQNK